jgi:hypothetical protein
MACLQRRENDRPRLVPERYSHRMKSLFVRAYPKTPATVTQQNAREKADQLAMRPGPDQTVFMRASIK